MSNPAKPAILPQQIELFDSWFAAPTETEQSRTLAFWDVIPWHLISHQRKGRNPEVITFEGVKIDDSREVAVHLTPAILPPAPNSAGTRVLFPGVREELVERVLSITVGDNDCIRRTGDFGQTQRQMGTIFRPFSLPSERFYG